MVGRKAQVSHEKILEKLLDFDIFEEDKTLKTRTNNVWQEVCNSLDNLINVVNLFIHVKQDRHNTLTYYKKHKGLQDTIIDINEENYDINISHLKINDECESKKRKFDKLDEEIERDDESENDSVEEDMPKKRIMPKNDNKKYKLFFNITVPIDLWTTISPIQKIYDDGREGEVLQDGWYDVMRDLIWDQERLPCAFSFHGNCVGSYDAYIKIEGHCTDCQGIIKAICEVEPKAGDPVVFEVIAPDSRKIPHSNKIRLQKLAKENVEKELLYKKPKQWRRDCARKLMSDGDPEPAHAYKLSQLQNAALDAKSKQLGIKRRIGLFKSLTEIKNNVDFNPFVRGIGYDKFFLMYWSPQQISVYNDILAQLNNPVSLDATASITLKIHRPDGDASDVFLSVMCTHIDKMIVPISQAMSEKNDTCFYTFWLQNWMQSGAKIPREMITDMGKALRNGACLAFNCISFRTYIDTCLMILLGESTQIKIQTQMRTDIAHLQHVVAMWPCFSKENSKVKQLYIKSVGFLSTVEKLDVFEKVLKYILIVAYSEIYNENCQKAMLYLINLIQTFKFDLNNSTIVNTNEKVDDHNVLENENDDNNKDSLIHTYIEAIKETVISKVSNEKHSYVGIQNNDYYLPNFGDRLVELSKEFVCWTNVMQEHFQNPHDVATSARSETYFGDLKRSLLHMTLRQDKVLVEHCRQIDADMMLARAAINNIKFENKVKQPKLDYNTQQLMVVERWKKKFSNIDFEEMLDDASTSIPLGNYNLFIAILF